MHKKIITKTDSNLITLQYKEVTDEAIIENELLIKELLFILKNEGNVISKEDLQKINEYNILKEQVLGIVNSLGVSNISEVETLVEKQNQLIVLKNELLKENFEKLEQHKIKIEQLEIKNSELNRKYEAQKNRKVVRLVDKVAKR